MTTNEMLRAIEACRGMSRDFYNGGTLPPYFDEKEIETAKAIARVLDGVDWFVAPLQGGGITFERDDLTIEVRADDAA